MDKLVSALFFFTMFPLIIYGQDTTKKVKILPVPTLGYSPETKTYIGAVSLLTIDLYQDSLTRISNGKLEFNYTWNKQIILESEWNYFFKAERWFTKGKVHYSKYPDFYYGIGANTPDSAKLLYNCNRIIYEAYVLKNIGNYFFTGINVKYGDYRNVSSKGFNSFPELTDNLSFGLGYSLLRDSRDNLLTPSKGIYFNFNASYNFSNHNFGESTIDIRCYKTWNGKLTWASRLFNESNFGNPPFYELAFLGGDKYVRGYTYGRYRDKNLTTLQTEVRGTVFWRVGFAAFGGLSDLYNHTFFTMNMKYNFGIGLRFLVDKLDKTNLRMDYAIGEVGNSGFYISFGESF